MDRLAATIATAGALFAGTNLDDMVVLAVLNVSTRAHGRPKVWQIWIGQYTGLTFLVVVSALAALGLSLLPEDRTWLLGLVPFGLGVYKLAASVRTRRSGASSPPAVATGLVGVIAVTIANGGDNIAAYTPVFRTSTRDEVAVTTAVFAVGVALWCLAGAWLVSHKRITEAIRRWGHWIIPGVFIGIGLYIFYKGGVLGS